jgi:hypothetical protein
LVRQFPSPKPDSTTYPPPAGWSTESGRSTFPPAYFASLLVKENRANRRPISFKDSTAFVSMGCFFVNSTQAGGIAKKTALKQPP